MTSRMPSPADVIKWFTDAGLSPVFRADIRAGTWTVEPREASASHEAPVDGKTAAAIQAIRQR